MQIDDTVLASVKKQMITQARGWRAGVCSGFVADIDTGKNIYAGHSACHAWVYHYFYTFTPTYDWTKVMQHVTKTFLVVNCFPQPDKRRIGCTREAAEFLNLWVARESPFSQFVVNRDDEDSLLKGGHILLAGKDGLDLAQTMWMCKIMRFLTEGGGAADTFMTLVKGGVDPMLAVYVASFIRSYKPGAKFTFTNYESHSTVVRPTTDPRGMVARKFTSNAKTTDGLFGTGGNYSQKVEGFCKPIVKSDGWGGTVTGHGATPEQLVAAVLEWQNSDFTEELKIAGVAVKPYTPVAPKLPDSKTVYLEVDM